jgi:hypothetical protein
VTVPAGWLPVRLDRTTGDLVWCEQDTIAAAPFLGTSSAPGAAELRTPITAALVGQLEAEALPLSGLILHLSRSGSTLVATSLATQPGVRVLNEPDLLDQALTAFRCGEDPDLLQVRAVLAALGRPAAGAERYVLKLDSWHALALDQLRRIRPNVAWLFVYRDPAEVLASHLLLPGAHTVPGVLSEVWFGAPESIFPAEHAARVLGAICAAIRPHARAATLLNYAELPGALADRVPDHFGLARPDRATLGRVTARDAKRPHQPFVGDGAAKRSAITPELSELLERWVGPHYRALENVRHDAST